MDDLLPDFSATMEDILQNLPTDDPSNDPAPAPKPADPADPAPSPSPSPRAYPKTWKPDHASLWDTLPESHAFLKDEALRREDDFHKGIEQYKGKASMGERLERLLSPYAAQIQQYGLNVDEMLSGLLNAQMQLSLGKPEDRVKLMKQVVRDFKIDPSSLLDQPAGEQPYIDPALKALTEKVEQVDSRLEAENRRRSEEARAKAAEEVKAFAEKHEHFETVADQIALLMRADLKMTLEQAYEQAVWANPKTREALITAKTKADAEAAEKAERERAEKAAAATRGSTRSTPRQSSATAPKGTMEDTMRETLKAINARG